MGRKKRRARDGELKAHELDLHRLTVEQALARAREHLFGHWKRGMTPVLLITGKGVHSHDGVGRLHEAIKELLHSADAPEALGVRTCRPACGGGAWLVDLWPPRGRPKQGNGDEQGSEGRADS